MKLNDIPECERCCGVDIDKLESDLKTAHEMIREFRKELEFYGNGGNFNLDLWEHPELGHFTGKRARAALSKHAEFLKKIGLGHDKK